MGNYASSWPGCSSKSPVLSHYKLPYFLEISSKSFLDFMEIILIIFVLSLRVPQVAGSSLLHPNDMIMCEQTPPIDCFASLKAVQCEISRDYCQRASQHLDSVITKQLFIEVMYGLQNVFIHCVLNVFPCQRVTSTSSILPLKVGLH